MRDQPNESTWLEFKVNNKDPREIGEYVSALAYAAMLAGRDRAFLVYGIQDKTMERVGTDLRLQQLKHGNEDFTNWQRRPGQDPDRNRSRASSSPGFHVIGKFDARHSVRATAV